MSIPRTIVCIGLSILALTGCGFWGATAAPQLAHVNGTVIFREPIALPPDAVINVKLFDLSQQNGSVATIGEQVITNPGQTPIPFEVTYDLADINPDHTYAIHVRVTVGGQLRYITPSAYNVITRGNPSTVEVTLRPVS